MPDRSVVVGLLLLVAGVAACGDFRFPPTPVPTTVGETMPAAAYVWITAEAFDPPSPVDLVLSSRDDPALHIAHTFGRDEAVLGAFTPGEGRYTLSALGGRCTADFDLQADQEAQLRLVQAGATGCVLGVTWQGDVGDATRPPHGEGVLITNGGAGDATPRVEPGP